MSKPDPSNQTTKEWLADYDGTYQENLPLTTQVIDIRPKTEVDGLRDRVRNAGITSIRHVADRLLINTDSYMTSELNNKILKNLNQLASIAEPDTGESLYVYSGYRTLYSKGRQHLALEFKEIYTGANADRFFNIILKNKQGKNFKTGVNGEFRIVGSIKRPVKGSFIKFWMDTVTEIPSGKPSHIYRHMNPKLSATVISCPDSEPHHGDIKLHTWKCEGRLYKIT